MVRCVPDYLSQTEAEMVATTRVKIAEFKGVDKLFTPEFNNFMVALHDRFTLRIHDLRSKRAEVLENALRNGILPDHLPPSDATTSGAAPPAPPPPAD